MKLTDNSFKNVFIILSHLIALITCLIFSYLEKIFDVFFPKALKSLAGEIILLTGSANGIGSEIARELASCKDITLICWDVDVSANERLVAELQQMGVNAHAFEVDVSRKENIAEAAEKIRSEIGHVTIVINNAGIAPYSLFLTLKPDLITKVFEVNLFAHFFILREFVPSMISKRRGHIVSMASLNAYLPNRDQAVYASTKHAMTGFLDSFREEIRDHPEKPNIHITTVYPIFVQTDMISGNRVIPRFPSIAPVLTPEYVARETVRALRQNKSHVFLPPTAQIFVILTNCLPSKFIEKLQEFLMNPNPVGPYAESSRKASK